MMDETRIRELLQRVIDRSPGDYTLDDVIRFVAEGKMQLWTTENSVAVTEIICYPRSKVVLVVLAAGDLTEIRDKVPMIERFARQIGANRITLCGRRGWVRALADLGFNEAQTWAHKEV